MARPKLLDLFCGAGGCSMGYYRAGFDVTGVDIQPQPRYPFRFIQADALVYDLSGYDVIHASPPCQAYSSLQAIWKREHPDLLPAIRKRLQGAGVPWIIENVIGAPVFYSVILCGSMFGLKIKRHRHFETSHYIMSPSPCKHDYRAIQVVGHAGKKQNFTMESAKEAMGIEWMTKRELTQAIPPVYTEYVGKQYMEVIYG